MTSWLEAVNEIEVAHGSCQGCGRVITVLFLYGERWLCFGCHTNELCADAIPFGEWEDESEGDDD